MPDVQAGAKDVLLVHARQAVRVIERLMYRELSEAEGERVERARQLLRLTVGLRRGLDSWKE
jgi:hypothetical protein